MGKYYYNQKIDLLDHHNNKIILYNYLSNLDAHCQVGYGQIWRNNTIEKELIEIYDIYVKDNVITLNVSVEKEDGTKYRNITMDLLYMLLHYNILDSKIRNLAEPAYKKIKVIED